MKIPKYWAKGFPPGEDAKTADYCAWGWSFDNLEEARKRAAEKAHRISQAMQGRTRLDRYAYGDTPMREEVLETIGDSEQPVAMITRNRYGARVLNTSSVLFVDVDFPAEKPVGLMESLRRMFSADGKQARDLAAAKIALQDVAAWWQKNPAHSLRIYRTAAGLRLLFTDKHYLPESPETLGIMQGLKSDPLYVKLCKAQACFRARLTPKPWRCKCPNPPNQYPWDNSKAEAQYRDWEKTYARLTAGRTVCQFLSHLGDPAISPEVAPIVELHDAACCRNATSPLA